jgi:mannose-6-phosphate isomerase
VFILTCATRDYAWGSRSHIARFIGVEPSGAPQAEMWIGAHRGDPSRLPDGRPLDDFIASDPDSALGRRVRSLFGARLPFLVKALAASEPSSLQVHPTSERARIGYAQETASGIDLVSPTRNYKDDFHKPELVFALTRFEGMAGFRDVHKSAQILGFLDLPWADDVARRLESGPAFQTLRSVATDMLALSGDLLADLLRSLG